VRIRGAIVRGWPKKSYKFDFNPGRLFRFSPEMSRVEEININTTYGDKSYVRAVVAFGAHADAGTPSPDAIAVNVQRNGEFFSVANYVEQVDDRFLTRVGLDEDGALYKFATNFIGGVRTVAAGEKATRLDEGNDDLVALVAGVAPSNPNRAEYVFDNIDLPAVINYMAMQQVLFDFDYTEKNFYLYRDSNGSGEWQFIPWDKDLTFGVIDVLSDTLGGSDDLNQPAGTAAAPSHPFFGSAGYSADPDPAHMRINHIIDAIINTPTTREMYLRRLRTLMDEFLNENPAGTPREDLYFESRFDALEALVGPEAALDKSLWASPWPWGSDQTMSQALDAITEDFLPRRRTHLFVTHNIDNVAAVNTSVVVSVGAASRATVPLDDSLGSLWTGGDETAFATAGGDASWQLGTTGVGFDRSPDYTGLIGTDILAQMDDDLNAATPNVNDTVFIRIPFEIGPGVLDAEWNTLTLRMKYDDGFVAYINGRRIADENAPAAPASWNDSAIANNPDQSAAVFENFTIDLTALQASGAALHEGTNILAIHGLNDSTLSGAGLSSDMLFVPELVLSDGQLTNGGMPAGIPNAQAAVVQIDINQVDFDANPASGNQDEEYIRLDNPTGIAVDISGWSLQGGVAHTFAPGTVIAAGGSLFVSPDVAVFRARQIGHSGGQSLFVQGNYSGHMSNFGEVIELVAVDGSVISTLTTPSVPSNNQQFLRITEIHYHPADATPGEIAAGYDDGDLFEFIELHNIGDTATLNLAGVTFTDGITYTFGDTMLPPGGYAVLVSNAGAFAQRYGSVPIIDQYAGNLSNGGESLKLEDFDGSTIHEFTFDDNGDGWHPTTDGDGYSLVIRDVTAANSTWSDAAAWRPSFEQNGSPGTRETLLGDFNADERVDLVDLAFLQSQMGASVGVSPATGDLNGNGVVDRADVARFVRSFGRSVAASPAVASAAASAVVVGSAQSVRNDNSPVTLGLRRRGRAPTARTMNIAAADVVFGGDFDTAKSGGVRVDSYDLHATRRLSRSGARNVVPRN
ncbi:MAG: CotH kinase family protein, partial [Pirellulales bacterium]